MQNDVEGKRKVRFRMRIGNFLGKKIGNPAHINVYNFRKKFNKFQDKTRKLWYNKSKEQQRGDFMNYSTVSVRLTEEEKKDLEIFAKSCDLTMSQVIRKAVKEYIERNKVD